MGCIRGGARVAPRRRAGSDEQREEGEASGEQRAVRWDHVGIVVRRGRCVT
jgi:hypothetical protein